MKNKYFVLFLFAFILRLVVSYVFYSYVFNWPVGSSLQYRWGLAESISNFQGFTYNKIPNLYQTPVYPFFLALIFIFLGKSWLAVSVVQAFLEAISCILITRLCEKIVSKFSLLSGYLYAIYPYAVIQSIIIIDTSVYVFLFLSSIYCFCLFVKARKIYYLIIASFVLGVGILNRPSMVVVFPAAALCLYYHNSGLYKYLGTLLLYATIVFSIPFFWMLRNYSLTNTFPVLSLAGQHFLWYAHNENILDIIKNGESPDIINRDARYIPENNITVSDFFSLPPDGQVNLAHDCTYAIKQWFAQKKLSIVLQYTFLKLLRFVSWEYYPSKVEQSLQDIRLYVYSVFNFPITVLGWLGLLLIFRDKKIGCFLFFIAVLFVVVHVLSIGTSRHKIPLDALLIVGISVSVNFFKRLLYSFSNRVE